MTTTTTNETQADRWAKEKKVLNKRIKKLERLIREALDCPAVAFLGDVAGSIAKRMNEALEQKVKS